MAMILLQSSSSFWKFLVREREVSGYLSRQNAHDASDFIHANWFAKKMTGTLKHKVARPRVAWIVGHVTNGDFNGQFSNAVERLRPVEARHLDIKENDRDLGAVIAAMVESFLAGGCGPHVKAQVLQVCLQDMPKCRLVIDNENATALAIFEPMSCRIWYFRRWIVKQGGQRKWFCQRLDDGRQRQPFEDGSRGFRRG
jgi:hypothetical protein